jgi:putative pyruvate formate lyase activating enzyme
MEPSDLANLMIGLQKQGCHNINFVTPTHFVAQILEALSIAVEKGLKIPLVYNCGGYESVETIKLLDGIFDIYMPDIKYADSEVAEKYSKASDYPSIVMEAVKQMHLQVGDLQVDENGIAMRGLLVRHLVLPNNLAGSKKVFSFLASEISKNTYLNIMAQYRPMYKARFDSLLNRSITPAEYSEAVEVAYNLGLKRLDERPPLNILFF